MLAVLDANVLVSALLSPFGPPARVLDLTLSGEIRLAYDDRLMAEYREVLARPKFGFAPEDVIDLLAFLEANGEPVMARPLACEASDPGDLPSLEVAMHAEAILVTGNAAHYPASARGAVVVLTPAEYLSRRSRSDVQVQA
jgi:putative PIN family toxin of toxin-antitoxin system